MVPGEAGLRPPELPGLSTPENMSIPAEFDYEPTGFELLGRCFWATPETLVLPDVRLYCDSTPLLAKVCGIPVY